MSRQRVQLWLLVFCIGLFGIPSFSLSAQEQPEPEDDPIVVTGTRRIAYVAPGTDGTTTDIYTMTLHDVEQLLDEAGWIDHDNDPTTPRVAQDVRYEITNITNTPGVNEIDPQFSWDGTYIAYRGEADPATYPDVHSLFLIDTNGQNRVQITPNGVNVLYANFNPNWTQVAFNAQWDSSQFKIYRSDLDGTNQFTLTSGEGFNAGFPLWRVNGNEEEEIDYLRTEDGTTQVVAINPLTAETLWSTDAVNQQWILQPLFGQYGTFIQREDSDSDWEVATINLETREITQLTDNTTNDCCAVWSVDGVVISDMAAIGALPAYYLSDTEDGGRDIYSVNLDGSNPVNLTADDEREYTSVVPTSTELLLTGYIEHERDEPTPRLGFYWNPPARELVGDYGFHTLTEGSDPDVVDPISLEQLEGLEAAGLLSAVCEMQTVSPGAEIYSQPSKDTEPVQVLIGGVDFVEVNAYLPATPSRPEGWYHLTDGRWVPESHVRKPDNCPPLPTISPYLSANL